MVTKFYTQVKNFGSLAPIAAVTAFLPFAGSAVLIMVAYPLAYWLRENWEIGTILFTFGILFFCGLALLPTNVVGVVSGWSFSFGPGLIVLMGGIVGASLISFLIHRRIAGERIDGITEAHPRAKAVYNALLRENAWRTTIVVFLLRASIIMPFAFTNFLMAAARVPLRSYLIGTFLGMLPRSTAVVLIGSGLSDLSFEDTTNASTIIPAMIALIASVVLIGRISKHALDHVTRETSPGALEAGGN